MYRRDCLAVFLILILAAVFSQPAAAQSSVTISDTPEASIFGGQTMGPIRFRVVLAKNERQPFQPIERLREVADLIEKELSRINQLMSTYIDDSDVSKFNRFDQADQWMDVDAATAKVVQRSIELSELTDGAFDITVGPLVDLWSFGAAERTQEVPADLAIEQALAVVGFKKLKVRMDPPALSKSVAELQIDLSAIAKGFAVDQLVEVLEQQGFQDFLVEIGGEVAVRGKKNAEQPFLVGILHPSSIIKSVRTRLPLTDRALATSGDYQNFFTVDGETYSHTIDPNSGRPVKVPPASCSIMAESCMDADAIATAMGVLGGEKGIEFCRANGYDFYLIERLKSGGLAERASAGFEFDKPVGNPEPGFAGVFAGALAIFLIAVIAMAVGVIFSRRRIQGSCGGIASLQSGSAAPECSMCSQPADGCADLKKEIDRRRREKEALEET